MAAVLEPVRCAMDHDQPSNAESQNDRGRHECSPQRTRRVEPPVAAKSDHDIPLQPGDIPTIQTAADLRNHCYLKEAAAGSAQQTERRKYLSQQEYRHSTSQQFRRMLHQTGSTVGVVSIIQRTLFRLRSKTTGMYRK